jgi:hypothetical protein
MGKQKTLKAIRLSFNARNPYVRARALARFAFHTDLAKFFGNRARARARTRARRGY